MVKGGHHPADPFAALVLACWRAAPLLYLHSLMLPSSPALASSVGSLGFHLTQFTSAGCASSRRAASLNDGICSGSMSALVVGSSSCTQIELSPDPARHPTSPHFFER